MSRAHTVFLFQCLKSEKLAVGSIAVFISVYHAVGMCIAPQYILTILHGLLMSARHLFTFTCVVLPPTGTVEPSLGRTVQCT